MVSQSFPVVFPKATLVKPLRNQNPDNGDPLGKEDRALRLRTESRARLRAKAPGTRHRPSFPHLGAHPNP